MDLARLLLLLGLGSIIVSLGIYTSRSVSEYQSFRKNYFDPWPPPQTLLEMQAENPGIHSSFGYYQDTGLSSLDATQMHFVYHTDGVGVQPHQYYHNEVGSTDFDVVPIRSDDFRATDNADQIWIIKPKKYGLCQIGVSTSTYEVDDRTGDRKKLTPGAFAYKTIYVDPPILSLTWFSVHFTIWGPLFAAIATFVLTSVVSLFGDSIKNGLMPNLK